MSVKLIRLLINIPTRHKTTLKNAATMNFSTTNDDFKTLINGVDERITFIQHIETGFYNISKARLSVLKIKNADNEARGYPPASLKPVKDWFDNDEIQMILEFLPYDTQMDDDNDSDY